MTSCGFSRVGFFIQVCSQDPSHCFKQTSSFDESLSGCEVQNNANVPCLIEDELTSFAGGASDRISSKVAKEDSIKQLASGTTGT